jgi:cytoskeletal protein RodZ
VSIRDGTETSTFTFDIEVLKGEESSSNLMIIIIIAVVIVLIILAIVLFFVFKKRPDETEEEKKDEEDDFETQIKKEMERHQQEKEWEREHMKPHEPENDNASVPLSAAEAHAHDKDNKYNQPDYEELYGQPAPEVEDGDVSTQELRDHIRETADHLEQMDHPVEEEDPLDKILNNAHVETNDTVERGVE